jgi:hypothetical protein
MRFLFSDCSSFSNNWIGFMKHKELALLNAISPLSKKVKNQVWCNIADNQNHR